MASTITHNNEKRARDIPLADVEITEIENALAAFKTEVAPVVRLRVTYPAG